ncbi:MAG: hypothetical protein IJ281_01955 [Clostridia bacterium]|nr:hypothetical protein [Clostridia bacterium]
MKKIVALCLTLVMAVSLCLTAIAAPGAFVASPSGNKAPELVSFTVPDGCNAKLVITPYAERHTLDEATRLVLEEAYKQIANHIQNNDFSKALKAMAESKGMTASELSVSDLFDISYYGCEIHEEHKHQGGFTITLKAETLGNLVGVLHMNNKNWENVQVLACDQDAKTVTFYVENLSPFAIVVDNGSGSSTPPTGDNAMVYLGVALVAAAGLVFVLVGAKKKKA